MFQKIITNAEFLLAVLALVQTLVLNYFGVPEDIWISVNAILLVLIGTIAVEKSAEKFSNSMRMTLLQMRGIEPPLEEEED